MGASDDLFCDRRRARVTLAQRERDFRSEWIHVQCFIYLYTLTVTVTGLLY